MQSPSTIRSLMQWFAAFWLSLVLLLPVCLFGFLARPLGWRVLALWSRCQMRLFGVSLQVDDHNHGQYPKPPYVFVLLNQTSLAEAFVAPHALPLPFQILTNIEFAMVPFVGWAVASLGAVVVVRQWPKQARRGLDRAVAQMRRGVNFYMSIEGARSRTGALLPYKKGPAVLAIATGASIIPVMVTGAREIWPHGSWRVAPGTIKYTIGKPVSVEGLTYQDRDAVVQTLWQVASGGC